MFAAGREFYAEQRYDSAEAYFKKAAALDSKYIEPLNAIAQLHYVVGMQQPGEKNPARLKHFRTSFAYFAKVEMLGSSDAELYERLSELSNTLGDERALLRYAKRNAELYPYERQHLNLGYAYSQSGDHQSAIRLLKEAVQKFTGSHYIGSLYLALGRAYTKVDRDQTAERTFEQGLRATDTVLIEVRNMSKGREDEALRRLLDDKRSLLMSLKALHQRYKSADKLRSVEDQLRNLEGGR
jgi:tetratricopeptide (TPR) repeat protein